MREPEGSSKRQGWVSGLTPEQRLEAIVEILATGLLRSIAEEDGWETALLDSRPLAPAKHAKKTVQIEIRIIKP